ncbi:MAG: 16S rRNA (cytosine(1402)-N(4))-methyltransferase RsmH [Alphaproteobacteria bacterium]|nr:16S rRNA (cytosine(1402)-N(4))-methyltransferase RsmH [Alphaproteobacteria bacterium]
MLREVLQTLKPKDGGIYVDGTFGAGGYTRAILKAADCTVYAIDRDPEAHARAVAMARDFPGRLIPLHGRFGNVAELLADAGVDAIDGLVLDLGVSSIQLATPGRGFSFMHDGPLDMRMDNSAGESAGDVVNRASEKDLADIIFNYGEERAARRIAKRIVAARAEKPLETTKDLVRVVHDVLPMHGGMKTDTATRTFQALRIYINDELGELERALEAATALLKPEGRLVVVSFHSLEDWRVKNFLKEQSGRTPNVSRHMPLPEASAPALFTLEKNSGLAPTEEETKANPRARSARLRYAIRTAVPAEGGAHA